MKRKPHNIALADWLDAFVAFTFVWSLIFVWLLHLANTVRLAG